MKILLLSSAFSGLTQRFYTELDDAGYVVSVELHHGDIPHLIEGIGLFKPDLIFCPYLTQKIPAAIYQHYKCLIVHPGIVGDRGASSLDWAIQNGETEWGVTLLEAQEEMDLGDIWAKRTFPMRHNASKSNLFNREVTQGAVDCLWEVLSYFDAPDFIPSALDYNNPKVKGQLKPAMKQKDRTINWKKQKTDEILRHIHAADGSPGVLDEIFGQAVFLYNAHKEENLKGKAGEIIATANHAICRATVDGAIWIGHLKPKLDSAEKGIKLPAVLVLKEFLPPNNSSTSKLSSFFSNSINSIDIDYTLEGQQLPCQEVWYQIDNRVAYIYSPFHNGGMSTEQCRFLLSVFQHVSTLDVDVIVLMGGEQCWSNGIHLNHIEIADDPAEESWLNINAIDDLILQIINTLDKVTISAVAGSAGAGGAILAIATDKVFVREGVIINPHYKNMGQLYGSEYWTYLLPKRVGEEMAVTLTDVQRLPISAKKAWRIGLIDTVLDKNQIIFTAQVKHLANSYIADKVLLQKTLKEKAETRCVDETKKALASYRQFELTKMHANFYGNDIYNHSRKDFVYKNSDNKTPDNIALHRQKDFSGNKPALEITSHFVWQAQYEMDDEILDKQHKSVFIIAENLLSSQTKKELLQNIMLLDHHVKEHFSVEEALMQKYNYQNHQKHEKEHSSLLQILLGMVAKINENNWEQIEVQNFVDQWKLHIVDSDIPANNFMKQHYAC